jgi:hypothetical protein
MLIALYIVLGLAVIPLALQGVRIILSAVFFLAIDPVGRTFVVATALSALLYYPINGYLLAYDPGKPLPPCRLDGSCDWLITAISLLFCTVPSFMGCFWLYSIWEEWRSQREKSARTSSFAD